MLKAIWQALFQQLECSSYLVVLMLRLFHCSNRKDVSFIIYLDFVYSQSHPIYFLYGHGWVPSWVVLVPACHLAVMTCECPQSG